jgi:hypothetical protein
MHHYRIIHADDGKLALAGKHMQPIAKLETIYELTAAQAQAAIGEFIREYDAAFPVLLVDSIGSPVATDPRNWAHRLGKFSEY